jgi:hypothetical protein
MKIKFLNGDINTFCNLNIKNMHELIDGLELCIDKNLIKFRDLEYLIFRQIIHKFFIIETKQTVKLFKNNYELIYIKVDYNHNEYLVNLSTSICKEGAEE